MSQLFIIDAFRDLMTIYKHAYYKNGSFSNTGGDDFLPAACSS